VQHRAYLAAIGLTLTLALTARAEILKAVIAVRGCEMS
jgi:hypothetical protein